MDNRLLEQEIGDLNMRFISLCIRADEPDLPTLSVKLNVGMPFLRALRSLSRDQLLAIGQTPRCLLQPALDERSIRQAGAISCQTTRALFLSATKEVRSAHY